MNSISDRNIRILFVVTAVTTGFALLSKIEIGNRLPFFSSHPYILYSIVYLLTVLPFCFPLVLRWHRVIAPLTLLGFAGVALVLQPQFEKLHSIGRGTDQGTCVIVAAHRLLKLQWPYDAASMFSHNPMSCGPGWVMLHAPLLAFLPYPLTMLALIFGCIGLVAYFAGVERASRFVAVSGVVPGTWLSLANGNDFLTFAFCVVAVIVAIEHATGPSRWFLSTFVILVSHFRMPFIFPPFVMYLGAPKRPLRLGGAIAALSLLIWSGFYFINPVSFMTEGPMHVLRKFQGLSGADSGLLLFVAVVVGAGFLTALFLFYQYPDSIMAYVACIIWPLSILELAQRAATSHSFSEAFELWEGTSWLEAVAAISAWFLIRGQTREKDIACWQESVRRTQGV
ncbi:MAG: hypothetical protein WDN46_06125 [Methylocella sp.]